MPTQKQQHSQTGNIGIITVVLFYLLFFLLTVCVCNHCLHYKLTTLWRYTNMFIIIIIIIIFIPHVVKIPGVEN